MPERAFTGNRRALELEAFHVGKWVLLRDFLPQAWKGEMHLSTNLQMIGESGLHIVTRVMEVGKLEEKGGNQLLKCQGYEINVKVE